jgi:hypothetical protein
MKRLRALHPVAPGALIESILWPANTASRPQTWREAPGACGLRAERDSEANARLIAAAPDTYDVTVALVDFDDEIGSPAWNRLVEMARNARAKAEGR